MVDFIHIWKKHQWNRLWVTWVLYLWSSSCYFHFYIFIYLCLFYVYRQTERIQGIQGTSKETISYELNLRSLTRRRWRNKLIFLFKVVNSLRQDYFYSIFHLPSEENYPLRSDQQHHLNSFTNVKNWLLVKNK